MVFNVIAILVSIVFQIAMMGFIALRFKDMEFSFWQIPMRYIFYRDLRPIQWLTENIIYLYYLIFIISQFVNFLGLVHQLRLPNLGERMPEFYISSPLSSITLTLIFIEHFRVLDRITDYTSTTIRTLIKKRKIKNH